MPNLIFAIPPFRGFIQKTPGGKESGSWDGSPPPMADAYERVASDLFKLLSRLRFSLEL